MLSLLAQMTLLITGETGGASGRQVDPVLPNLPGVQVESAGYQAVTHGRRACFPNQLATFAGFLKSEPQRQLIGETTLFRWRHSWFVVKAQTPELLNHLGANAPEPMQAQWEEWQGGGQSLRCVALDGEDDDLAKEVGNWEIRWSATGQLPGVGPLTEIARPLGDGSRRLQQIRTLRTARPDLIWFDLGGLFEGRSLIRDGLDLHRKVTATALHEIPPQLLLPNAQDLAGGLDHLLQELKPGGTELLVTGSTALQPGMVSHRRYTQDGQRVLVIGLGAETPPAALEQAVESLVAGAGPDEWVVMLCAGETMAQTWILDPRISLIAMPGPVRFGPFSGRWQRGEATSGGPLLLQVAPNRLLTLTLQEAGRLKFHSMEVDERTTADPKLAGQINRIRHALYPDLNRTVIPPNAAIDEPLTVEALLARAVLRAADADAVLLPPLAGDKTRPGSISRMQLRAKLRIPGYLVRRRVEGKDLLKAKASFGSARLTSREKISSEAPLLLVTTAELAEKLAKVLGPGVTPQPLRHQEGSLVPAPQSSGQEPTSLRDLGVSLIERQLLWDDPNETLLLQRVTEMMRIPTARSSLRLRIDRLSLSVQEVSLRAPLERRTTEDPRATSPTRMSVGSQFDLRLEQPWSQLLVSLRGKGEYRRESFPSEDGADPIDKEAVDDLKGSLELAARTGSYRPFGNLGLDSEFTPGAPEAATPEHRQMLATVDAGLILPKYKALHEARLSATALRDYGEALASTSPAEVTTSHEWRFGLTGLVDLRRKTSFGSLRLLLGARLLLPETEPQPNTLLWSFSERIEYAFPLAGGLNLKAYFEHLSWRTHAANPAPSFADTWLSGGLSLDFSRVLRPLAGLF